MTIDNTKIYLGYRIDTGDFFSSEVTVKIKDKRTLDIEYRYKDEVIDFPRDSYPEIWVYDENNEEIRETWCIGNIPVEFAKKVEVSSNLIELITERTDFIR